MAFAKKLFQTSLIVGGTLGFLSLSNKVTESMAGELDTVLTGEERRYAWKYGDIFYNVKGSREAKPLVLIHSFGPGASSFEWRKNLDALAENFRVYALDLLGFGLSDRPAINYDAETFADLISDFMKEVIGKPAIVVAHGLPCAYVIASAYRHAQYYERLILLAPPLNIVQEEQAGPGFLSALVKTGLRLPIVGQALYNLLTSRRAIRGYYDKQGYHNPGLITDELVEYVYTSAHQPGTRYATASLFGNTLNLDVHEPLARLQMPVVAVWGREGTIIPSEASEAFKRANSKIDVRIFDKSSFQIQEEQVGYFNSLVREFSDSLVK